MTRRGDPVRTQFDALNRQTVRTTPSATYPQVIGQLPVDQNFPITNPHVHFPFFAPGFVYDALTDDTLPALVIPTDVARFSYDAAGRVDTAVNNDARVVRRYFPGGALTELQQLAVVDTTVTKVMDPYSLHNYQLSFTYDLSGRERRGRARSPRARRRACRRTSTARRRPARQHDGHRRVDERRVQVHVRRARHAC